MAYCFNLQFKLFTIDHDLRRFFFLVKWICSKQIRYTEKLDVFYFFYVLYKIDVFYVLYKIADN